MRISLAAGVFSIAVLAAACGGGGGNSGALPTVGKPGGTGPVAASKTAAAVVLHIPKASAQARAHKPFIITANTKSVVITIVPAGATPSATDWQVFPVTTPTPCQLASDGSETCTFIAQALFGNDTITISTYAVTNPGPTDIPLATATGTLDVSRTSNGATPPPLNIVLDATVTNVAVTVPSPEPSNTPNTQVFTVGVAQSPLPLGVVAYDSSGSAILSTGFSSPIKLTVTPENAGVTLAVNGTCTGSSGSGNTVSIGCSADLANVTIAYDGSVTNDANDNITDTFAIVAVPVASPAPSPAHVVLQSNVLTYAPNAGGNPYYKVFLQALPNNMIGYMLSGSASTASYGTLNATTGALSAPVTLAVQQPNTFYAMSDGSIWVTDTLTDTVECFSSGGGNPVQSVPLNAGEYPTGITFDGTKLWWGTYGYTPSSQNFAYSAAVTSSCTLGSSTQYTLPTTYQDGVMFFSPLAGGAMAIDGADNGEFYTISSGGAVSLLNPGFSPGSGFGGGVATDGTGKTYAAFAYNGQSFVSYLSSGGTALTQLFAQLQTRPQGSLAAFGPNNTLADRIAYADPNFGTFDIVEGPNGATPLTVPITLGNASFQASGNSAISTNGSAFIGFENNTLGAPVIARPLLTTTWSVPVGAMSNSNILSIDERGDSGPFTVTPVGTPPSCFAGVNQVAGTNHAFGIGAGFGNGICVVTLQVTDKSGRSQIVIVNAPQNNS